MRDSRIYKGVVTFVNRGGSVRKDGRIIGITGKERTGYIKQQGRMKYKHVTIKIDGRSVGIPIHQIVAYLKYGDKFKEAECVRHLDGHSLNNSRANIGIGTHSENAFDKPKELRSRMAKNATRNVGLSDETWEEIREKSKAGMSYSQIMETYGISSKGTISYRLSETAKHKTK